MEENPCLKYNCSFCCNPIKINCLITINIKNTPFVKTKKILIPEKHPESIRLNTYSCNNFDCQTGLCKDYSNRPIICRNTRCLLFNLISEREKIKFAEKIQSEKFIEINY